jgi:hypothetical protein
VGDFVVKTATLAIHFEESGILRDCGGSLVGRAWPQQMHLHTASSEIKGGEWKAYVQCFTLGACAYIKPSTP